jgi:hypothetical protein
MLNRTVLLLCLIFPVAAIFAQTGTDSTETEVVVDTTMGVLPDTAMQSMLANPELIPEAGPLLSSSQLQRQKWYTSIPEAMGAPEKVYKLTLADQKLKAVPREIVYFANLQVLDLGDNKIKLLPGDIAMLKNLEVLILTDNKLRYLPEEMRNLENLHTLFIGGNKLVQFPAWLGGLGKLRTLNISRNNLTTYDISQIEEMLPRTNIIH